VRPPEAPVSSTDPQLGASVARPRDPRFGTWFPERAQGFHLDDHADQRSFGGKAPLPIGDAAELLGLERERLEPAGVKELLTVGYVGDTDDAGRVAASILCFTSADAALAFLTTRVGEAMDLGRPSFSAFPAGALAVLGDDTALVLRAETVVRLEFANAKLPPERVAAVAAPALMTLGDEIARRLPGESTLPPAARLLPEQGRVRLSLRYDAGDLCDFAGIGPGARATYADGEQRYRMALAVRIDFDAAKDVLSTLRKREGSRPIKNAPYDALRVAELDPRTGAVREWIFGHKGVLVAGVALDAPPRAAPRGAPPERERAILRLKRLLDALPGRGAW
jgi:hypothetical protein